MFVSNQLLLLSQPLQGTAFKNGVIPADVVQHGRLQHEESAIDPAFTDLGLFGEFSHQVAVEEQTAEPCRRANSGDCRQFPVAFMKSHQAFNVNVGDAVSVGEHEPFATDQGLQPLDSPPGLRGGTGIDEAYLPVRLLTAIMGVGAPGAQINGQIIIQRVKLEEVFLDLLALVTL